MERCLNANGLKNHTIKTAFQPFKIIASIPPNAKKRCNWKTKKFMRNQAKAAMINY